MRWVVALVLCLAPTIARSHADVAGRAREAAVAPASASTSTLQPAEEWTCWFDGAPLQNLPLPTPKAVARTARAGQVLAVESVELTPFGTEWVRVKSQSTAGRLWVPLAYVRRVSPDNPTSGDLPVGQERVGPYDGLPIHYQPSDLAPIPARYCYNDVPQRLRAEARQACREMLDAAKDEAGLHIKVLSSYRSAQTQAYLCRQKIKSEGIGQQDVARPGHSEHQLGTTVDLVADNGLHLLNDGFGSTPEGRWLQRNCHRFAFIQSYTKKRERRDGSPYEPWHYRYVGRANVKRFTESKDE